MANEILARQAQAHAKHTGEPFEDALESVLKTEAGVASLGSFATGPTAARKRPSGTRTSQGGAGESAPRPLGSSSC